MFTKEILTSLADASPSEIVANLNKLDTKPPLTSETTYGVYDDVYFDLKSPPSFTLSKVPVYNPLIFPVAINQFK